MSKFQASDVAYEKVRSAIIDGSYRAGDRLVEADVAAMAGVSRTPVREALRRLAAEGFVQIRIGSSAIVNQWTHTEVAELFEIRAALEALGAGLAVQEVRSDDIKHLSGLCDRMESSAEEGRSDFLEEFSLLNTEFHGAILKLSGNSQLAKMGTSLMKLGVIMRTYSRFQPAHIQRSMIDHRLLVAALRAGSATRAEATMRSHILASVDLFNKDVSSKEK